MVLSSGDYPWFSGGKELTPLPPQEEKSSSPSPLPTLGPLWGANGEGDDLVEKDLPAAEGSPRAEPPSPWSLELVGKGLPIPVGRRLQGSWSGGGRDAELAPTFLEGEWWMGTVLPPSLTALSHLPFFALSRR